LLIATRRLRRPSGRPCRLAHVDTWW